MSRKLDFGSPEMCFFIPVHRLSGGRGATLHRQKEQRMRTVLISVFSDVAGIAIILKKHISYQFKCCNASWEVIVCYALVEMLPTAEKCVKEVLTAGGKHGCNHRKGLAAGGIDDGDAVVRQLCIVQQFSKQMPIILFSATFRHSQA